MLHRFVIHALWLASQLTLVSSEALAEHSGLTNRYFSLHNRQLKKKPTPPLSVRLRWATYVCIFSQQVHSPSALRQKNTQNAFSLAC